jgi:hypothetical protein
VVELVETRLHGQPRSGSGLSRTTGRHHATARDRESCRAVPESGQRLSRSPGAEAGFMNSATARARLRSERLYQNTSPDRLLCSTCHIPSRRLNGLGVDVGLERSHGAAPRPIASPPEAERRDGGLSVKTHWRDSQVACPRALVEWGQLLRSASRSDHRSWQAEAMAARSSAAVCAVADSAAARRSRRDAARSRARRAMLAAQAPPLGLLVEGSARARKGSVERPCRARRSSARRSQPRGQHVVVAGFASHLVGRVDRVLATTSACGKADGSWRRCIVARISRDVRRAAMGPVSPARRGC